MKKNFKNSLIGAGTVIAVIAPITAVVSCDSKTATKKSTTNGDAGTESQALQYQKLADIGHNELSTMTTDFSSSSKSLLTELRQMRVDYGHGWAPIGDSMIDTVNDFRFIVLQQELKNPAPRLKFKEFINSTSMKNELTEVTKSNSNPAWNEDQFNVKRDAVKSMNAFLNDGNLSLDKGIGFGASSHRLYAFRDPKEILNMKPLVPSEKTLAWAQYRANQVEWKGTLDPNNGNAHDAAGMVKLIEKEKGSGSYHDTPTHFVAHAPARIDTDGVSTAINAENIGPEMKVTIDGKPEASKISDITTYEAYSSAWKLFVDKFDGSGSVGHRANFLNTGYSDFGWSMAIGDGGTGKYDAEFFYEFSYSGPKPTIDLTWLGGPGSQILVNQLEYDKLTPLAEYTKLTHDQLYKLLLAKYGTGADAHTLIDVPEKLRPLEGNILWKTTNKDPKTGKPYEMGMWGFQGREKFTDEYDTRKVTQKQKDFFLMDRGEMKLPPTKELITPATKLYDLLGNSLQALYEDS